MRGETLGLVGESGCGKSTTARLLLRLLDPTSGSITFDGREIAHIKGAELKALRREMQMIFQDPYSSLNPRKTVGSIISDPFVIHGIKQTQGERKQAVQELMDTVGLNPEHYNRYPHEFSGGQRQRIGVARALALKPKVIVADEPVSALDVSIQAQVLNLLRDLQRELGLTLIFIAHDLSVVRHMCDRVAVMYLGRIVELATSDQLYSHPRMPYTGALMSAVPVADPRLAAAKKRQVLTGDVPSPTNPPPGCRFHTRCWKAQEICRTDDPPLEAKDGGNLAACHFPLTDAEVLERVPTRAQRQRLSRASRTASASTPSASSVRQRAAARVAQRGAQEVGDADHVLGVGRGLAQRLAEDAAGVGGDGRRAVVGSSRSSASVGWAAARAPSSVTPCARSAAAATPSPARRMPEQQVLGAHPRGAERGRLLAGELDRGARLGGDAQARGLAARRRLGGGRELAVAPVRGLARDAERAGDGAVGAAGVERAPGLDALEGVELAAQRGQRVQRDLRVRGADGVLEQLGEAVREVYRALQPRSMVTGTPLNAAPPGPARNAITPATSSGSISRLTACGARITSSSTRSSRRVVRLAPGRRAGAPPAACARSRGRPRWR